MPSNKPRLYVALYARGGAPRMPGLEDTYVIREPNSDLDIEADLSSLAITGLFLWGQRPNVQTTEESDITPERGLSRAEGQNGLMKSAKLESFLPTCNWSEFSLRKSRTLVVWSTLSGAFRFGKMSRGGTASSGCGKHLKLSAAIVKR